jgi:hypothetical protein
MGMRLERVFKPEAEKRKVEAGKQTGRGHKKVVATFHHLSGMKTREQRGDSAPPRPPVTAPATIRGRAEPWGHPQAALPVSGQIGCDRLVVGARRKTASFWRWRGRLAGRKKFQPRGGIIMQADGGTEDFRKRECGGAAAPGSAVGASGGGHGEGAGGPACPLDCARAGAGSLGEPSRTARLPTGAMADKAALSAIRPFNRAAPPRGGKCKSVNNL